jgi:hypothetical protein
LFVPQPTTGPPGRFAAYAKALAGEAEHYGVGLAWIFRGSWCDVGC